MTTQCEQDKYIKCKGCKCKYINDDEHVKQYFGYHRLGEQLKTRVKCRSCSKKYKEQHNSKVLILMQIPYAQGVAKLNLNRIIVNITRMFMIQNEREHE